MAQGRCLSGLMRAMNPTDITYLGRQAERLSDLIEAQTLAIFERGGVVIPVKSCSLLEALSQCQPASASDLASRLGRSHQIVIQKMPKLLKLDLIERHPDPEDARRQLLSLTPFGREQLELMKQATAKLADAYRAMERDSGPVFETLLETISALEEKPLIERIE